MPNRELKSKRKIVSLASETNVSEIGELRTVDSSSPLLDDGFSLLSLSLSLPDCLSRVCLKSPKMAATTRDAN